MSIFYTTICIVLLQSVCPVLANINTDKLKDEKGYISIKSRFNTKLTTIEYVKYYSFGGRIIIILTDIYLIFVYGTFLSKGISININKLIFYIIAIPIVCILFCGIICFLKLNVLGIDYLMRMKRDINNDVISKINKVLYYSFLSKLKYLNVDCKNNNIKGNIWNEFYISVFAIIIVMIFVFLFTYA